MNEAFGEDFQRKGNSVKRSHSVNHRTLKTEPYIYNEQMDTAILGDRPLEVCPRPLVCKALVYPSATLRIVLCTSAAENYAKLP